MPSRTFSANPTGATRARHYLRRELVGLRVSTDVAETAELLLSELASNVVRHARTVFTVTIFQHGRTLRVEVEDGLAVAIAVADLQSDSDSGRGLRIIEALAERWGVDVGAAGKTVWFEISSGHG